MRALICIPTYNERDNIEPIAQAVFANTPAGTEILFIDDGSPDGTGKLADALAARNSRVHVLHRSGKLGLATAYIQGFQWGMARDYDWFFEMDADFSHDPPHLREFFAAIESGKWDAVCGSRYVPGGGVSNWSRSRLLLSQMGSVYSRMWLRYPVTDWTGGWNAWSRRTVEALCLDTVQSKGYCFQIELKYRALVLGKRLLETPIIFRERRAGQSKMSGNIVKEALWGVVKLRIRNESSTLFLPVKGPKPAPQGGH